MKFQLLILLLFCNSTIALNQHKVPPEEPITHINLSHKYDTINAAAIAALKIAAPLSKQEEWGGAIMKYSGKFYYTNAVTLHLPNTIDFVIQNYMGAVIVGMYHTHPISPSVELPQDTEKFSVTDMQTALRYEVYSYIWSEYDNTIRVFIPHKTLVIEELNLNGFFDLYSYGDIILKTL
jgi:hypothetical protein